MCVTCEHMLYEEHRSAEAGPFDPCPECKKFPSNDGKECCHCFSIGNTLDECAECQGQPWSEDFLAIKAEIESQPPGTIHASPGCSESAMSDRGKKIYPHCNQL